VAVTVEPGSTVTATELKAMNEYEQYRRLLFSIAYRMTGSVMDAEDLVQEAYMRYQSADRETIENPKAYLMTITTRLSLNHMASARVQRETYLGPWLPEPVLGADQPVLAQPSHRVSDFDSISMAFMVLLENLTPPERAVFILREVFDYPYHDIAEMLDKSEAACRKLYSRAKAYVAANRPRFKARPSEHRRLLEQFQTATTKGDLDGLTDLLTEEATLWVDGGGRVRGAATRPVLGRQAVAQFLMAGAARFTPAGASTSISDVNGLPALLVRDAEGAPAFVASIEVRDGKIHKIWATGNPDKLKGL
jgi:RNA polymerase sigma-70 factor (ECF subfamily)